ncbi:hypothetical protein T439DRAFT_193249 [Meredithblackwellia eburnea MCA 4105]
MEKASLTSVSSRLQESLRSDSIMDLVRSTPYVCPNPTEPRPSGPFKPGSLSPFTVLKSTKPDEFTLELAYSTNMCNQFRIKISRTDPMVCRLAKSKEVSRDPETQAYITNVLGPDTFQLRVDGAERFVIDTPTHYDWEKCEYSYDFRLATTGVVWFSAMRLYKNYDGFYELHANGTDHLNPANLYLTVPPLQLNLCGTKCAPYQPPLLSHHASVFDPSLPDVSANPPSPLPACTGPDPIKGSYVASSLPSILYPPVPLPMSPTRPSAGLFDFVPEGCTFQHDGMRFKDHTSCMEKPEQVLFIGDSHTRAMYDALVHRLEGNDSVVQLSQKIPSKTRQIGNLYLEFTWDPFIRSMVTCEYISRFSSVIVSTGSHQACWECVDFPTVTLQHQLFTIFTTWPQAFAQCRPGLPPTKFIYMNSPAFAYPGSHYRLDCRTGPRLEYWNNKANYLARAAGWAVVDTFMHSRPFAIDTYMLDGVHYLKTDAIDPMADEVIEKLGICGNTGRKAYHFGPM